jgi:hypothetical protein
MMKCRSLLPILLSAVLIPSAKAADFEWHEVLRGGSALEVKGISGDIKATPAEAGEAFVSARKSGRRDDPASVEIHVARSSAGVIICAVYPDAHGTVEAGCPDFQGDVRNNDVRVDFEVRIPKGVRLVARSVNGSLDAKGIESDVEAHTVNGSVRLATTGFARAETVNGVIEAALGQVPSGSRTFFRSVNGSIRLTLPRSLDARISAHTVNGGTHTDFPIENSRHRGGSSLGGTLGTGSADVSIETVNGSITLEQAP